MNQADRCREVGLAIGWLHPFFLIPLSYLKFEESDRFPTMAVHTSGRVLVNPGFAGGLDDRKLAGCVCHEIMHLVLGHADRRGARDQKRWNVATDLAINTALRKMGIDLPAGVLMPPGGSDDVTAEDFYEMVPEQNPDESPGVAAGCGVEPDGDVDSPGDGKTPPDWEVIAHQSAAAARGTKTWEALAPFLDPKPSAVAWRTLLRATLNRVAAAGGRDVQTMTRRNRRSPDCVILPGWVSTRPTVAVAIDTSGSMSDDMLSAALGEVGAIGAATGVRVFAVLHDAECYWAEWLDVKGAGATRVGRSMTRRGGTDASPAYRRVGVERARFDVLIHLTDGELGDWPTVPDNVRRLVAAFVSDRPSRYRSNAPAGATSVDVAVGS